jgi:hypothetical protein
VYPEFLPDPKVDRRNSLREKLERMDMLNRRSNIDIPEFYTGEPWSLCYRTLFYSGCFRSALLLS